MNTEKIFQTLKGKEKSLFATHDLNFPNFCKAIEKGSLSWPSFAMQEIKVINEDKVNTGYAGSSMFGQIRLVVKGDSLIKPNTYTFRDNVTVCDSNFYSAMIPSVQHQVCEDTLLDYLAEKIGDDPMLDVLMHSFMDSISDEAFDSPIVFADFHSEVVRTPVFKFLFSRDIAKDRICNINDQDGLFRALENSHYQYNDARYDHFISEILDASSIKKSMLLDGDLIDINKTTSEAEIIDAFYEKYPISEVGALLRQMNAGEHSCFREDITKHDNELLASIFTRKIDSISALDDNRDRLINASGIIPYSSNKSRFSSSIHVLKNELSKNPTKVSNIAMGMVFYELNTTGTLECERILDLFCEAGVIVNDAMQAAVENCIKYKDEDLKPFFEMKVGGEFDLQNISHIVVPDVIKEDIENRLADNGLVIPVFSYNGKTVSELEWGRVIATLSPDINEYLLLDRDGLTNDLKKSLNKTTPQNSNSM